MSRYFVTNVKFTVRQWNVVSSSSSSSSFEVSAKRAISPCRDISIYILPCSSSTFAWLICLPFAYRFVVDFLHLCSSCPSPRDITWLTSHSMPYQNTSLHFFLTFPPSLPFSPHLSTFNSWNSRPLPSDMYHRLLTRPELEA